MSKNEFLDADEQDESLLKKNRVGDAKSFSNLIKYTSAYKLRYIISISLLLSSSIFTIVSSRYLGEFVEKGLVDKDISKAILFASIVLILELFSMGVQWGGRSLLAKVSSLTILDIRKKLFKHLHKLPISYYDRQPHGRIVTRITHDIEGIDQFFTNSLGRLCGAVIMAITACVAMCVTDLEIGLILISMIIPAVFLVLVTKNIARDVNRKISKASSSINSKLSEFISGIDVIRSYGLEDWSNKEFKNTVSEHMHAGLKANLFYSLVRPCISFLCALPLVALLWFGGHKVLSGTMSVGVFIAYIRYCEKFFMPIMMLSREIHVVQEAFTNAERVSVFLDEKTEDDLFDGDGSIDGNSKLNGELNFSNIWMSYSEDDWVLRGIDFSIAQGEKIGLVGTTGSGKTSAVSLLSRLYDYQKGEIYLDGKSLRTYKRSYLRSQIGFVSQDAIIFRGSLRDNLTLDCDFTDDEIISSCKETGLHVIMSKSELTLESEILEGGGNLSAGEKQLLALTRVLLNNPSLLILDEATANIDPGYERVIHDAVDKIMNDRTCLIIAHRLETIQECDRLLVFDKGKLVESGTPQGLLDSKGFFYGLQSAQKL